jgi:hypothetical protein
MSSQPIEEMQPKVKKSGNTLSEFRNTTKPLVVTEHLRSFLRALGEPVKLPMLWKNTREDVILEKRSFAFDKISKMVISPRVNATSS